MISQHELLGQRTRKGRILCRSEKSDGEEDAGETDSQKRTEQFIGVLNLSYILMTGPVKGGSSQNQDRAVNEQSEHQGHGGIDGGKLDRLTFAPRCLLEFPRLHNGRMQIKIMRHHCRAQNTDADVEHLLIQDNARARDESESNSDDAGFRENQLDRETGADG